MIFDRKQGKGSSNPSKELQKLKRQDLLELLLEQMRENDELRIAAAENRATIAELTALSDRLKDKLNNKDATIDRLKAKLDGKDVSIARFKDKLDDKDALLEEVYGHIHELSEAKLSRERSKTILLIEDLLAGHFISQLKQHVEAESMVEEDSEAEPEEVPADVEPEELAEEPVEEDVSEEAEPEPESTEEPEASEEPIDSEPEDPEQPADPADTPDDAAAPEEEATE